MQVTAFAPVSIGNISLGFDILGAAMAPIDGTPLGDVVSVSAGPEFSLRVAGRFADRLPSDPQDNIVSRCYQAFHQACLERGISLPCAHMLLSKNLPVGSGLGSSGSSIVAALVGLNQFYATPLDNHSLLSLMGQMEGHISGGVHYDNVAPSFLGGLTLMVEEGDTLVSQLPTPHNWHWVLAYSGLSVSTAAARQILPKEVPLADAITFGRRIGVFVDALHRGNGELAARVVQDALVEPHRKQLLPGFTEARQQALANGALAFGISGSGPTVFALCDSKERAQWVARGLTASYLQGPDGFCHVCRLDDRGARILDAIDQPQGEG